MTGLTAGCTYYFNIVVEDKATNMASYTTVDVTTPPTQTIQGVPVPVAGDTPVNTITPTTEYTGTVIWTPADSPFGYATTYTATITLTAEPGYSLAGAPANYFTVAGVLIYQNLVTDHSAKVALPDRGVYIIISNNQTIKIVH